MLVNKAFSALAVLLLSAVGAAAGCTNLEIKGQRFTACSVARGEGVIETYNLDRNGEPLRFLSVLANELGKDGKDLRFAMNAGMYDDDQLPIGLYVEDGRQTKKLNRRNGGGNFHLKPNGVFYVKNGKADVIETEAFVKSGIKPEFATQSGPMLVINGQIHPKFSATGTSRKLRNGVGVDDKGVVSFVISEGAVTFWEFASVFKNELKARNALFFDGTVSSLYAPEINRNDGFIPLGPMVGVTEMQ